MERNNLYLRLYSLASSYVLSDIQSWNYHVR